jgi:hypothetical protein
LAKPTCRFPATLTEALKGKAPTSRIDGHSTEQISELTRTASIERAVGPLGQFGNLSKAVPGTGIAAFMEHEGWNTVHTEYPGELTEFINIFFHTIADKYQGIRPLLLCHRGGLLEYPANLCVSAKTTHRHHFALKGGRVCEPTAGLELPYSAVVTKLDLEPAEGGSFGKHFCLNMAGVVPSRFAARRSIHREDQSSGLAGRFAYRQGRGLFDERIDL